VFSKSFISAYLSQIENNDKKTTELRKKVKIVHPFHPDNGKEYEYLERIRTNKEDKIRCIDENGKLRIFQTKITDMYEDTSFSVMIKRKCIMRIEDIIILKTQLESIGKKNPDSKGKYVASVNENMSQYDNKQ